MALIGYGRRARSGPADGPTATQPDPAETLEAVLDLVVSLACTGDGVTGASAAVTDAAGRPVNVASDEVCRLDLLQRESGRGPSVDVLRWSQRQHVALATAGARWPEFTAAAVAEGVHTVLALPLRAVEGTFGSLVVYSRERLRVAEVEAAQALCERAALALAGVISLAESQRASRALQNGMATRGLIGQAQGLLMAGLGLDSGAAFARLRQMSQAANQPLRDVAAEIVDEHEREVRPS